MEKKLFVFYKSKKVCHSPNILLFCKFYVNNHQSICILFKISPQWTNMGWGCENVTLISPDFNIFFCISENKALFI